MEYIKLVSCLCLLTALSGCVKYYDGSGQLASKSDVFECDHKCGYYDTNVNAFGTAFCIEACMNSKGYSQNSGK
jgi:hypothetical protein